MQILYNNIYQLLLILSVNDDDEVTGNGTLHYM